jgi:hypothetical protein
MSVAICALFASHCLLFPVTALSVDAKFTSTPAAYLTFIFSIILVIFFGGLAVFLVYRKQGFVCLRGLTWNNLFKFYKIFLRIPKNL